MSARYQFQVAGLAAQIRGVRRRQDGAILATIDFLVDDKHVLTHVDNWSDAAVRNGVATVLGQRAEVDASQLLPDLDRMEYDLSLGPTYDPNSQSEVGASRDDVGIVRLEDLRKRFKGSIDWIVQGYIARGEVGFLAGAGESLKSWTAAHLAAAIDARFRWLGLFEVCADRVLFIEQERAGNLVYQLNRIEVGERCDLGSERLAIMPPTHLGLSDLESQERLASAIYQHKADVVIINALRDVLGSANENSPNDMANLLRPLGRLAEQCWCGFLIIDHFNKAGMTGVVRGNAAHGGTAHKHAEADFVLIGERPRDEMGKGQGPAVVSVTKRRNGEPGRAFEVQVSDTADGGVLVRGRLGARSLSSNAQLVIDLLRKGEATIGQMITALGKSDAVVRKALSELSKEGLVDSEGEPGKTHIYRALG